MRLLATLLVLLALGAEAQSDSRGRFGRTNSRCVGGRSDRGLACDDGAFLEFAPASGAGMGAACACTTPTGAKGEALTFTRGSDAVCSRQGLATTGIANGDLVVCTGSQPRVEPSGGVLGLRVESARTNSLQRSDALDNPVWNRFGIVTPPTPNFATSPYGTATATRVEVTTCAGSASVVFQDYTGTAATWTASVYLRGTSGSGSVSIYYFDSTAVTGNAVQCAFVSTEWRRCSITRTFANTTHRVGIGCQNDAAITGNANTGGADFLAATAVSEAGAFASSPIPTVASAVTRSAESATLPAVIASGSAFSVAATMEAPTQANGQTATALSDSVNDGTPQALIYSSAGQIAGYSVNPGTLVLSGVSFTSGARRLSFSSGRRIAVDATVVTDTATTTNAITTTISVGTNGGAGFTQPDGIITRLCLDPSEPRCR